MKAVIDRFEGNFAICITDDKKQIDIARDKLPQDVKESDIINIDNNIISIDKKTTESRKTEIEKLMDRLWD